MSEKYAWETAYRRADEIIDNITEELADYVWSVMTNGSMSKASMKGAIAEKLKQYQEEDK